MGCEFAQALQRLGCRVTLLHKYDQLMNREDADAAQLLQQVFVREGIHLILAAKPLQVLKTEGGKLVRYESAGQPGEIEVDEILAGAGRAPNVENLAWTRPGSGTIPGRGWWSMIGCKPPTAAFMPPATSACRTSSPTRPTPPPGLSSRTPCFWAAKRLSALTIPWCTYTDPEVAHVGINEAEAEKQGLPIQTFVKPLSEVDRAILDGETEGLAKIHLQPGTDSILGATIVARHAGEMISEITLAMVAGDWPGRSGLGYPPLSHPGRGHPPDRGPL